MNLLTQNKKLKATSKAMGLRVFNFGIPAYKSASGKLTCPMAKTNEFVDAMNAEILKKKPDYVRVHDSGDYYSKAYLNKWIEVAIHNPSVRFYSYTNMIDMMIKTSLPDNYDVIFSDAGKQKNLINKQEHRHTKIFSSHSDLVSANYADSSSNDLMATRWFSDNKKIGLVFH